MKGAEAMGLLATMVEMLCHPFRFVTSRPLGLYVLVTMLTMVAEVYYGAHGVMSPQLQACGIAFTGIAVFDACFAPVHVLFAWYCSSQVMARPRPEPLLGEDRRRRSAMVADEVLHHTNNLLAHDHLFALYFLSWICCFVVNFGVYTQMDKCRDTDFGSTITGLMLFEILFGLVYGALWYMVLACGCVSLCSCIFVFEAPPLEAEPEEQKVAAPYVGQMPKPSAPPLQQGQGRVGGGLRGGGP